jgi:hypothetical protein
MKQVLLFLLISVVVFSCGDDDSEAVLLPVINQISATEGEANSELIITGQNFGSDISNVSVFINGVEADIVSVTNTEIIILVPALAGKGPIEVTVKGQTVTGPDFEVIVTTNFENGDEGWLIFGDAQGGTATPNIVQTGGNPGAYLSAVDDVTGGVWYWQAPDKYRGDFSRYYGANISFDLKQSTLSSQFEADDVVLQGGGLKLVLDLPNNPGLDWTPYSLTVDTESDWRIDNRNGTVATEEQIKNALSDLSLLLIRGEYVTGPDTGGLDNAKIGLD